MTVTASGRFEKPEEPLFSRDVIPSCHSQQCISSTGLDEWYESCYILLQQNDDEMSRQSDDGKASPNGESGCG